MDLESSKVLLSKLQECAKQSGIQNKMFLGFGTLLGAIRERSIIPHDDDMDVCFIGVTLQEKQTYYEKCCKAGLMAGWKDPNTRITYKPDGEILWFSCKSKPKETKCCSWFFIEWADTMWHTKGKQWVSDLHFDPRKHRFKPDDEAVMKGAPAYLFKSFVKYDFLGGKYNIPKLTGTLLDFWYPNWYFPKDFGESSYKTVCSVNEWYNKDGWKLL